MMYKVDLRWKYDSDKTTIGRSWCCEQFGLQKDTVWFTKDVSIWDEYCQYTYYTCFYFEREEHRNWFLLRFS